MKILQPLWQKGILYILKEGFSNQVVKNTLKKYIPPILNTVVRKYSKLSFSLCELLQSILKQAVSFKKDKKKNKFAYQNTLNSNWLFTWYIYIFLKNYSANSGLKECVLTLCFGLNKEEWDCVLCFPCWGQYDSTCLQQSTRNYTEVEKLKAF